MAKKMISWNEAMKAREGKQHQPLLLASRLRREKEEAEKKEEAERRRQEPAMTWEEIVDAINPDDPLWDCAICTEKLHSDGYACVSTPCGHHFHATCLRNALRASAHCPTCRTPCSNDSRLLPVCL
ncbi:RING-type domain-containing protein [Pseudoscourfieldia marina]